MSAAGPIVNEFRGSEVVVCARCGAVGKVIAWCSPWYHLAGDRTPDDRVDRRIFSAPPKDWRKVGQKWLCGTCKRRKN